MDRQEELLRIHGARYSLARPQDLVKLLFQSEFGPSHFAAPAVPDWLTAPQQPGGTREEILRLLRQESSLLRPEAGEQLAEEIGESYFRLHLRGAMDEGLPLEQLARMFEGSMDLSRERPGSREGFVQRLELLCRLAGEGAFPFGLEELERYLEGYRRQGYPMVSHSEAYRRAYHPAYRVMSAGYLPLLPLCRAINYLCRQSPPNQGITVALDGRAASGKTTAARLLAGLYDANVVHMDDFFLPFELRTPQRFSQPGGNIHHERFSREVVEQLSAQKPICYRVFDCHTGEYGRQRVLQPTRITIVEGAYCLRPEFRSSWSLRVFFDISPQEQRRRILQRNGPEQLEQFLRRWIPLEEEYFRKCQVPQCAHMVITTQPVHQEEGR